MTSAEFREALKELGLTQDQAARLLRLHPRTIGSYARGKTSIPGTVDILMRLLIKGVITREDIAQARPKPRYFKWRKGTAPTPEQEDELMRLLGIREDGLYLITVVKGKWFDRKSVVLPSKLTKARPPRRDPTLD